MLVSGDLECALRSLADLVRFVLKGIDLPFNLLEGRALGRDKQASILAPGVAEEGDLHACRGIRCSSRISSSKAQKRCIDGSPC
jgi:hypothetical protein